MMKCLESCDTNLAWEGTVRSTRWRRHIDWGPGGSTNTTTRCRGLCLRSILLITNHFFLKFNSSIALQLLSKCELDFLDISNSVELKLYKLTFPFWVTPFNGFPVSLSYWKYFSSLGKKTCDRTPSQSLGKKFETKTAFGLISPCLPEHLQNERVKLSDGLRHTHYAVMRFPFCKSCGSHPPSPHPPLPPPGLHN